MDIAVHSHDLTQPDQPTCVNIMRYDYPNNFTQIFHKLDIHLQSPSAAEWAEALDCLYQLIKNFNNESQRECGALNESVKQLLPKMYQRCVTTLLPDQTEQSALLQKQILKIYFIFTKNSLPLQIISQEMFSQWMEIVSVVADRPVPQQTLAVIEKNRVKLPWWKCKKWALRIMLNMFKNYGSPDNVPKEYTSFSLWYLKKFPAGVLRVTLKILDQYKRRVYVSPPVLELALNYLGSGVDYFMLWKLMKPHMSGIVQHVLFPILSYSPFCAELWNADPREYIRVNLCNKLNTPVKSAENLLHNCCEKREGMLEQTVGFIQHLLNLPNAHPDKKDGTLHMIGSLADLLLSTDTYREQLENILCKYVFPEFASPCGHLKVRACWFIQRCSMMTFGQETTLAEAIRLIINALLTNQDLPVKFEAAIALTILINVQEKAKKYLEPYINRIVLELLDIICVGKIDMTGMLHDIMYMYKDQLQPYGVEMCRYLAMKFCQGCKTNSVTAKCLLKTFGVQVTVMKNYPANITEIQPIALNVVGNVFNLNIADFYRDALCLADNLTCKTVSSPMWKVLEHIYQMFQKDGLDYFPYMMPVLYNYITVDTPAFLSNENHMPSVFNICKAVLTGDTKEELECHAAKLLEVIILKCMGRIDHCILSFVELALQRLMRPVKTLELRTMCMQVVIAALFYNPQLLFNTLELLQLAMSDFLRQWIEDTCYFSGLHNCKMCVLGFCALLSAINPRPDAVSAFATQIIPSLIILFDKLKQIRKAKPQQPKDDDKEKSKIYQQALSSSDCDESIELLRLNKAKSVRIRLKQRLFSKVPDEDADDYLRKHDLESYTTLVDEGKCSIDECVVFKQVFRKIQSGDPDWHAMLVGDLTEEERQALQEILESRDSRLETGGSEKPPENELQKVGAGERVMSEHQLRVQRSLQKLNVPDWYKNSSVARTPEGFLLKRGSDASPHGHQGWPGLSSKTTSLSSLGSSQSAAARSPTSHLLSPSPTPHVFTRWSTSRLNSSATSASTSPCGSTRSSFNYRQPYLGWRSQERLSRPRTPAERLAAGLLPDKSCPSPSSPQPPEPDRQQDDEGDLEEPPQVPNLSEVRTSIKEVTSAIVHYVSGVRDGSGEALAPPFDDSPHASPRWERDSLSPWGDRRTSNSSPRSTSPRGSGRLCWLESSFVGSRPLDSPETPLTLTSTDVTKTLDSAGVGKMGIGGELYLDLNKPQNQNFSAHQVNERYDVDNNLDTIDQDLFNCSMSPYHGRNVMHTDLAFQLPGLSYCNGFQELNINISTEV